MRKVLSLVIIFLSFMFILPSNISATSGCCSGHGGVSCASGAQYNGHVICNDGWTGSSCLYSSMVECGGSTYYNYNTQPTCPLFSSYNSITGQCECYSGYIASGGQCISQTQACQNQLGFSSRYNSITGNCECSYGYIISSGRCTYGNTVCTNKYGLFSTYDSLSNTCKCMYGYRFNSTGTQCVSNNESCQEQYGLNSEANLSGDQCQCKAGYKFQGNSCVPDDTYFGNFMATPVSVNTTMPAPTKKPSISPTPTLTPQVEGAATQNSPSPVPTPTPMPIGTPQVKGVATENSPTPMRTPTPTPSPLTAGETLISLGVVSVFAGACYLGLRLLAKLGRK